MAEKIKRYWVQVKVLDLPTNQRKEVEQFFHDLGLIIEEDYGNLFDPPEKVTVRVDLVIQTLSNIDSPGSISDRIRNKLCDAGGVVTKWTELSDDRFDMVL